MVSVNATTWQSFKKWFMNQDTLPDLIALQEHKLIDRDAIKEASASLCRQGFSSVWGQAAKGPKKNPTAGVAVIAASKLGCKHIEI